MSGQKEVKFFLKPPIHTGQHHTKIHTIGVAYPQSASVKQHLSRKLTRPFCTATESWFMVNGSFAQDSLVPWFLYHESLDRIPFKWSRLRINYSDACRNDATPMGFCFPRKFLCTFMFKLFIKYFIKLTIQSVDKIFCVTA